MEEEISLMELASVIWRGKYVIIVSTICFIIVAAVFSILMTKPLYNAVALIDPTVYGRNAEYIVNSPVSNRIIANILLDKNTGGNGTFFSSELSVDNSMVLISVDATNPNDAAITADQIAQDLLRWTAEERLNTLESEMNKIVNTLQNLELFISTIYYKPENIAEAVEFEESDILLTLLDQQALYFTNDFNNYYKELLISKTTIEESLFELDQFILRHYGEMNHQETIVAMQFDPSYQALLAKKGEILNNLFDIEQKLSNIEKSEDPNPAEYYTGTEIFQNIITKQKALQNELLESSYAVSEFQLLMKNDVFENQIHPAKASPEPHNIRWQLNTAVAGVLGLMLSTFFVFSIPFLKDLIRTFKQEDPVHK